MPATGAPRVWLRLEGAAVVIASLVVFEQQHTSWILFTAAFLAPDLSMLGYLAGPIVGAWTYNVVHSYVAPIALVVVAIGFGLPALLPWALIWLAHIGLDRVLGYGLKYSSAFNDTHLGRIGRRTSGA
ncbi:MAG TPA: DUF4260 domain-containing protein [Vicinamibacterales bacterium]|nr:DUF4260 domain-containing protein [Vicinamibacterales bacterium]